MNDPINVRRVLRGVLALRSDREFTERMLLDAAGRLLPERFRVDELREAIEWNMARKYVICRADDDLGEDVYRLTPAGLTKERSGK